MSTAQDEVDRLFQSQEEKSTCHPEDKSEPHYNKEDSRSEDDDEKYYTEKRRTLRYFPAHSDDDDDYDYDDSEGEHNHTRANMLASKPQPYQVPTTLFDANTGPKGVIADAQSFERAKKRSFRRTLMTAAGFDYSQSYQKSERSVSPNSRNGDESDDDRFMREWRESRVRELQKKTTRRSSPSKRRYGSFDTVDADGYLDAVEKVTSDVVVVVCIYDPESSESSIVEDGLSSLARKHPTTRFIKLHHEIAEMDDVGTPAILAYRGGDVFATIVDILNQLPDGRGCSASSLEALLMQHRVL